MVCHHKNILLVIFVICWTVEGGLKIKNGKLVDEFNRQLLIKGGCVVVKVPPYFPKTDQFDIHFSFNDVDIKAYKEIGLNGVRLGAMWAGVEPTKDTYNITYLEEMVKFVNKLGSHGIYTLLEFHQDILSEKFCGDGVPIWLMNELNAYKTFPFPVALKKIPLNSSGLPSWQNCNQPNWAFYYMSDDVGRGFNHLYDINHKLHRKYVEYWKMVAKYFKGNPNVIAYQLINEPFVGDAARNIFLLLPSVAERLKFQRFYDSVAEGIREVDNDTVICFEPISFDFNFNTGFSHVPGGNKYINKSMMCYHFYRPPLIKGIPYLKARLRDGKRLGIPTLLSQYSMQDDIINFVEDNFQSYFYWQYKDFGKNWGSKSNYTIVKSYPNQVGGAVNPDGTVNEVDALKLARTCLQKTAGSLKSSTYRTDTFHYNAVYEATPGGTSVLYMSKNIVYKKGYSLDFTPRQLLEINDNGNYIEIIFKGKQPRLVMINVERLN